MRTYTKILKCLPFSRAVLQLIFQRYPNYRLYTLYYKYKSGQTLNGHYVGHDAGRDLIFLHDLDTGYKSLHKNFQVSTISVDRLTAPFSKVPKLEAVHLHIVSFLQFF